jgi:hypothetical protein
LLDGSKSIIAFVPRRRSEGDCKRAGAGSGKPQVDELCTFLQDFDPADVTDAAYWGGKEDVRLVP